LQAFFHSNIRNSIQKKRGPSRMANVQLWMRCNGAYQPALSIPVDLCQRFSIHPFTWLCYVGFTIHGHEGDIYTVPGGPQPVEYYDATIQPGIYYYVSQGKLYFSV